MNETITRISQQLGEGIRALTDRLPVILSDPRAYPRESMLIAAIVALGLILLLLVVIVLVDFIKVRRRRRRLGVKRRSRMRLIVTVLAAIVMVFTTLSLLPTTRVVSAQCGACHQIAPAVETWETDVHASVSCYGCHSTGGLSGSIAAGFSGIVRYVSATERQPEGVSVTVHEARCLACHGEIDEITTQGRVRMRHIDVIEAGFSCTTCHLGVGHGGEVQRDRIDVRSVMGYCLSCHDGGEAAADCEYCHDGRPTDPVDLIPAGNTATGVSCVGCHNTETDQKCLDCHGLVLPHPAAFKGEHAGISYNNPALCANCHQTARATEGCACHSDDNLHGSYSDWFPRHGPQASQTWPGGCNCHDARFCGFCHATSPFAG